MEIKGYVVKKEKRKVLELSISFFTSPSNVTMTKRFAPVGETELHCEKYSKNTAAATSYA